VKPFGATLAAEDLLDRLEPNAAGVVEFLFLSFDTAKMRLCPFGISLGSSFRDQSVRRGVRRDEFFTDLTSIHPTQPMVVPVRGG